MELFAELVDGWKPTVLPRNVSSPKYYPLQRDQGPSRHALNGDEPI